MELAPLLKDVAAFFEPLAADHDVALHCGALPDSTVNGDPAWLHQLFANLIHNAIKYTPAGGSVEVEAVRAGHQVEVRVHDTGIGIAPAETERIFERFHRLDPSRSDPGFGLGLPLAREIARAHRGEIRCESDPGHGSCFTVQLPLWETES